MPLSILHAIFIINSAITGEKSSIIPPPIGEESIICLTGPKMGSVKL